MSAEDTISYKYEVVEDLPMPEKRALPPRRAATYPFATMRVGDAFVVHDRKPSAVRSAVASYQKRYEVKFSVRTLPDGTIGVWRTE